MRQSTIERNTNETQILVKLNLDGTGTNKIQTGIGFFNHMLEQIAVHGLFDLVVDAKGDLSVDEHHTIEDVALTLGQAIDQALGDRKGINRMSQATIPMDEALCSIIIDISGRPYGVFQGDWTGLNIGGTPVSLIEHFFYSLSVSMKANIHAQIHYGNDDHHKAEALFKAFGRALAGAVSLDSRRSGKIPSSKGVL